jgi:hypothetical protein
VVDLLLFDETNSTDEPEAPKEAFFVVTSLASKLSWGRYALLVISLDAFACFIFSIAERRSGWFDFASLTQSSHKSVSSANAVFDKMAK